MGISAWISDKEVRRRDGFTDYIHGLIRHEMHKGEDNPYRLEVLSKIYYDLIYTENLRDADGWKKSLKGKDDYSTAIDKTIKLEKDLEVYKQELSDILEFVDNKKTKKDIIDYIEKVKKRVK